MYIDVSLFKTYFPQKFVHLSQNYELNYMIIIKN